METWLLSWVCRTLKMATSTSQLLGELVQTALVLLGVANPLVAAHGDFIPLSFTFFLLATVYIHNILHHTVLFHIVFPDCNLWAIWTCLGFACLQGQCVLVPVLNQVELMSQSTDWLKMHPTPPCSHGVYGAYHELLCPLFESGQGKMHVFSLLFPVIFLMFTL